MTTTFPGGFEWGAATASFQIEGAAADRGDSIWDAFCRVPGAIEDRSSGRTACDHVRLYRQDVALMRKIGLTTYRLSISWPRVIPDGTGAVREAGIAFYDRLVDELLAAGIRPNITLFHWDLPVALQHRGGWLNSDSPRWFAELVRSVVGRLGDRVTDWMTINEPQAFIRLGHGTGEHAPGLKLPFEEQLRVAHHVLLAHGAAVRAVRECGRREPRVGWAPVGLVSYPATESSDDVAAARLHAFAAHRPNIWNNSWFNDPVFSGQYPEDGLSSYGHLLPAGWDSEIAAARQPLDVLGLNIYRGEAIRADSDGEPAIVPYPQGAPRTTMGWEITPQALYWGPRLFHERYGCPIMITENGMASHDWICEDGRVHDPQRIDYTAKHLRELRRSIADGADVRAYFHWSLMDNFEWAKGYTQRFGLVFVDYQSQQRTLKDSAHWYSRVISTNGASLDDLPGPQIRVAARSPAATPEFQR